MTNSLSSKNYMKLLTRSYIVLKCIVTMSKEENLGVLHSLVGNIGRGRVLEKHSQKKKDGEGEGKGHSNHVCCLGS